MGSLSRVRRKSLPGFHHKHFIRQTSNCDVSTFEYDIGMVAETAVGESRAAASKLSETLSGGTPHEAHLSGVDLERRLKIVGEPLGAGAAWRMMPVM